jgi:hypothetical protein
VARAKIARFTVPFALAGPLIFAAPLPAIGATDIGQTSVSEQPAEDVADLARLCAAHGPDCTCPGCQAYFNACDVPCPPAAEAPAEGAQQPSELEEALSAPPSQEMSGPMPSMSNNSGSVAMSNSASPNMIGDSPTGGCGGLMIDGALVASLAHPLYGCSRLNISENNSAIARDRVYMSYRHYQNASFLDVFSYAPEGGYSEFDIDQYIMGFEKKWGNWTSFEFRLPINTQLDSTLNFVQGDNTNNLSDVFANGPSTDVGNLAIITKHMLRHTRALTVTGGMALNLPTAPDFSLRTRIDDPSFDFFTPPDPATGTPPIFQDSRAVDFTANGIYRNETVNLQPFMALQIRPNSAYFANGFLQVDVPLNESSGAITASGTIEGDDGQDVTIDPVDEMGTIRQQTLLRLNGGIGRWLTAPPRGRYTSLAAALVLEVHYTGTLDSPDRQSVDIDIPSVGDLPDEITVEIGPMVDSTNVVNGVIGVPIYYGNMTFYNGIGVPFGTGADRGYDFGYSFSAERRF